MATGYLNRDTKEGKKSFQQQKEESAQKQANMSRCNVYCWTNRDGAFMITFKYPKDGQCIGEIKTFLPN